MGSFSLWHWIIVLIVILILFGGRGKISLIMKDIGRGFRSLKQELDKDGDNTSDDNKTNRNKKTK